MFGRETKAYDDTSSATNNKANSNGAMMTLKADMVDVINSFMYSWWLGRCVDYDE